MNKKYVCIEPFAIYLCDDDGFMSDNKQVVIDSGTVWEITDNDIIGGEIHLEEVGKPWHWLEITKEHFERCFREEKCESA